MVADLIWPTQLLRIKCSNSNEKAKCSKSSVAYIVFVNKDYSDIDLVISESEYHRLHIIKSFHILALISFL